MFFIYSMQGNRFLVFKATVILFLRRMLKLNAKKVVFISKTTTFLV